MVANRSTKRGDGQRNIVDAARRLIAARGMSSFSVRELMQEADMSLGSYNWHFASRADLDARALTSHVDDIEKVFAVAVLAARTAPDTAVETLRMALLQILGDRTRALVAAELRLAATRDAGARRLQERADAAMAAVLTPLHQLTEHPRTASAVHDANDRLSAAAVRHAARWHNHAEFRRAVRRTIFAAYGGL